MTDEGVKINIGKYYLLCNDFIRVLRLFQQYICKSVVQLHAIRRFQDVFMPRK